MIQPETFFIPESSVFEFKSAIEKLSKRAVRLGFSAFAPVLVAWHVVPADLARKMPSYRKGEFLFAAEPVGLEGWTFIAAIDHTNDGGNLIRQVPNSPVELPTKFRTAKPDCDHCKVERQRNDTFVVYKAETKEFRQIGRQCLASFFQADPLEIARLAEMNALCRETALGFSDDDEEGGGGAGGYRRFINLATYLSHVAAMIRKHGWLPRSKAEVGDATADWAIRNMFPSKEKQIMPSAEDIELAEKAIEWGVGLESKWKLSEYEHNVLAISKSTVIDREKSIGIAASILPCYQRALAQAAERAAFADANASSEYLGKTGERLRGLTGKVVMALSYNGTFGASVRYKVITPEGNILVWYHSGDGLDAAVGQEIIFTGTVKKHALYNDVKETTLTRVMLDKPKAEGKPSAKAKKNNVKEKEVG